MAMRSKYNLEQILELAPEIIKEHGIFTIYDLVLHLRMSHESFYKRFRDENGDLTKVEELEYIKSLLDENLLKERKEARKRVFTDDSPTCKIVRLRLSATNSERKKIATTFMEVTGEDGSPLNINTNNITEHVITFKNMGKKDDENKE